MRVSVCISLQPANEITAIEVDSAEEEVLEVSELGEQDAALEPGSQPKYFSLCRPFRVYPDGFRTIGNRTNDTGDFNARSGFLRPCCRLYLRKGGMQPDNSAVLDDQILKTFQFIAQTATRLLRLKLNSMKHASLKKINHFGCESFAKTTYAQFHPCFLLVFPLQSPDSAQKTHTKSKC